MKAEEIEKLELIGEEIFMEEDHDEQNPVNVYCDGSDTKESPIRIFTVDQGDNVREFRLTEPQSSIETLHRDEILEYCIGKYTDSDEVSLKDIFMHTKYVEEIL